MKNFFCCASLALLAGCATQPQGAADTRSADAATIREAEIAWSKAAGAKQLDATVAYYTDESNVLPPNAPMATGKAAARKTWEEMMALPGFAISWQPVAVVVSQAGDLGYTRGTYELTMNDPKGKPSTDRGKYMAVWKKQTDGSWKAVEDMFNSDLPLPAPAK